jgi:hypothetical protein
MYGCNEEAFINFVFDTSRMSKLTKCSYEYKSGLLNSSQLTTYTILNGQKVDSFRLNYIYKYNTKGLLENEIIKTESEDKPSNRYFTYNLNDSLTLKVETNENGDTLLREEYKYFPDGRKIVFKREIIPRYIDNPDQIDDLSNNSFDTIQDRFEYQYKDNLCVISEQFDVENNLIKTIKTDYNNSKKIKETHISHSITGENDRMTKFYDYTKSETRPDWFFLDTKSDTIELCKIKFYSEYSFIRTEKFDYGNSTLQSFIENGKEIGTIYLDKESNLKMIDSYEYFENGDISQMGTYYEEINAH